MKKVILSHFEPEFTSRTEEILEREKTKTRTIPPATGNSTQLSRKIYPEDIQEESPGSR